MIIQNEEWLKGYQEGKQDVMEEVEKLIDELNKKYPAQCYGNVGIKWNEELKQKLKEKN